MEPEIIIVGCANVDVLVYPASEKVFKQGSYGCQSISMQVGGDAMNEATILSKMGKKVELVCTLGKDDAGNYLMNHALSNGIMMHPSVQKENMDTALNVVMIDERGERHFLVNTNSSLRKLTREDVPSLHEKAKILSFASIFVFTDFMNEGLSSLFMEAKEKGMIVCADCTKCKNKETVEDLKDALAWIDYFFPNEEEACLFTGKNTVEESADVLKQAGIKNVIIKCGEKGCYLCNDEEKKWIPVKENVSCIDTTGAGDSFVAGFLKCLLEKKDLDTCLDFANACGSMNVQSIGACSWVDCLHNIKNSGTI